MLQSIDGQFRGEQLGESDRVASTEADLIAPAVIAHVSFLLPDRQTQAPEGRHRFADIRVSPNPSAE